MTDYDELDEIVKDRIAEAIEDLNNDRFIDNAIEAANLDNTNAAVDRVIKLIREAANSVVEL